MLKSTYIALPEEKGLIPSTQSGCSYLGVTPVLGDLTPPGTPVHIPYTDTHIIFSLIKAHKNQREICFFVTFLYVYFIRLFFFETKTSSIVEVGLKLRTQDPPALASQILGSQVYTTIFSFMRLF